MKKDRKTTWEIKGGTGKVFKGAECWGIRDREKGEYRGINRQEERWISRELVPLEGHLWVLLVLYPCSF